MFNNQEDVNRAIKNRKYAEELLGVNNRDYLNTQRDVAKDIFKTNYDTIQNNFKNLQERLEAQRLKSNRDFNAGLVDVADDSFNRVGAMSNDLVSRGLTNSGLSNKVNQADVIQKGAEVDKLLSKLGQDVVAQTEALKLGGEKTASAERNLNANLGNTLGDIGARDVANQMAYNRAASGIAGSKDARDDNNALQAARRAANAAAMARSGSPTKEQQDLEDFYKRQAISNILEGVNEDGESLGWDDKQKANALSILFDIDGKAAVNAYKNNNDLYNVNRRNKEERTDLENRLQNDYDTLNVERLRMNDDYRRQLEEEKKRGTNYSVNPYYKSNNELAFEPKEKIYDTRDYWKTGYTQRDLDLADQKAIDKMREIIELRQNPYRDMEYADLVNILYGR